MYTCFAASLVLVCIHAGHAIAGPALSSPPALAPTSTPLALPVPDATMTLSALAGAGIPPPPDADAAPLPQTTTPVAPDSTYPLTARGPPPVPVLGVALSSPAAQYMLLTILALAGVALIGGLFVVALEACVSPEDDVRDEEARGALCAGENAAWRGRY
ncbi:hypothetical protein FA95DRAFT_1607755 [Auriscalpium vulgare]|uniref:Uncharacterized protein n=1 Tax=Auriscalpium vulgare TaxID=40419 RepID=A0ACB8RPF1_9AGAM|nr:hypothetical protein FA95DRAFT_1607755 [Auriscalpium vulgare]